MVLKGYKMDWIVSLLGLIILSFLHYVLEKDGGNDIPINKLKHKGETQDD